MNDQSSTLKGKAEITIGGQPQNVSAGELLIMPANIAHALQAKAPFNKTNHFHKVCIFDFIDICNWHELTSCCYFGKS